VNLYAVTLWAAIILAGLYALSLNDKGPDNPA
jgi:hypothetical protein